ncbi:MAG: DUF1501 domain-containing protein [Polyangiaceae bacterium]
MTTGTSSRSEGTSRRGFLGGLTALLAASSLASPRSAFAAAAARPKSCIVLWMNGGPSHLDTWDPKTSAKIAGPFRSIATRTPGLRISEHLPRIASVSNHLAVVRGMTSREGNHARASYLLHTGYAPNPTIVHPALGGWMAKLGRGDDAVPSELPAFVSLGGPSASAGFLGVEYGPFVVRKAGALPENLALAPGVDAARAGRRTAFLDSLEEGFASRIASAKIDGRRSVLRKARALMDTADVAAFDVSTVPEAERKAYGGTAFGDGCLVARRLVEKGVRTVEVVLDGWDTHDDGFTRVANLSKTLDPAFSALVQDLAARGLLAHTLVVCMGEFGRTPVINARSGRDHHPGAWSAVLAGGGIRGGVVHGATDDRGDKVVSDAVTVPDLFATVVHALGIAPDRTLMTPIGRPIAVTDEGTPVKALLV